MNSMARLQDSAQEWTCRDFARVLGPYLDTELDAGTLVDAERHVAACEACRERVALARAMRGSLKQAVRTPAPDALRARVMTAMIAEKQRSEARAREADRQKARSVAGFRMAMPLAAAAAVGLLAYGVRERWAPHGATMHAGFGDDILSELVAEHVQPLPYDATDPKKVRVLEQYVGIPVRTHAQRLEKNGVRFVGGRVLPVRRERAAVLQYEVAMGTDTRRVSVLVFDPHRIQVNDADLAPRAVGSANVRVGHAQGYSVAVAENGGVGYVVAADMDPDRSAQFAAHLAQQPANGEE